jgi:crotonobetainyl-CoA:carnitine CoA-transferase CaiB-like acyl-CoA transferase
MVAALLNRRQIKNGQVVDIAMSDSIGWLTQLSWNQPSESSLSFQLEAADGWVVVQKNYPNYPKELNRQQLVNFLSTKGIEAVPVLEVDEVIQQESLVQRGFLYQIATQNDEFADLISPPLGIDVYEPKTLFALGTHNYLLDT